MRQADQSTDNASANSTDDLVLDTERLWDSRTVSKEFQKNVDRNSDGYDN